MEDDKRTVIEEIAAERKRQIEVEGFVDQHGVFMSRFEAFDVASTAGQIAYLNACGAGLHEGLVADKLYSEGLY